MCLMCLMCSSPEAMLEEKQKKPTLNKTKLQCFTTTERKLRVDVEKWKLDKQVM